MILDDLQLKNLKIYRNEGGYTYGADAVLLSNFTRAKRGQLGCDLGTGTAIIPLLVYGQTEARFVAIDSDEAFCAIAAKSVEYNNLRSEIEIINANVKTFVSAANRSSFDFITCNPPYFEGGTLSPTPENRSRTHECETTLGDFVMCAKSLLKNGGNAFFCYPVSGLAKIISLLEYNSLPVKRLRLVRSKPNSIPYLALIESKKNAKQGLRLLDDIVLSETT